MGRSYIIAGSEDQAGELIDAAAGFLARTPDLKSYAVVEGFSIVAANGASWRGMRVPHCSQHAMLSMT
jgi:hypothetical protein